MAAPIFRVDLSANARDFQPTATEPGLPMLDPQGVNFMILKRWLGDIIAEPELGGNDSVAFYVREDGRGRLENVECRPTTKKDLEGPLADELQTLRNKIKKAKPESSTEQLLHRIVKKAVADITSDLDAGDHDSYLFKCRASNEPWRLVWCWGYQRSDLQPAPANVCTTDGCKHLFVKRPTDKAVCPLCHQPPKKRASALLMRLPMILLLLLLAVAALLAIFFPPRLVVTPGDWAGPPGSQVDFHVEHQKWYFWKKDVTHLARYQSHDSRVIEFDPHGSVAHAKNTGTTVVSFRYGDRVADAEVEVLPPAPPESIVIVPENITVGVGTTTELKVLGKYADGNEVDVTNIAQWKLDDSTLARTFEGGLEGTAEGSTTLHARFPTPPDSGKEVVASTPLNVVHVNIDRLQVELLPNPVPVGQSSRMEIDGLTPEGESYSLNNSSHLTVHVEPSDVAQVDGEYLVGKKEGGGQLKLAYKSVSHSHDFTVGARTGAAFAVAPLNVTIGVDEYFTLDIIGSDGGEIQTTSADNNVVEVIGDFGNCGPRYRHNNIDSETRIERTDRAGRSCRIECREYRIRAVDRFDWRFMNRPTSACTASIRRDADSRDFAQECRMGSAAVDRICGIRPSWPRLVRAETDRVATVFGGALRKRFECIGRSRSRWLGSRTE